MPRFRNLASPHKPSANIVAFKCTDVERKTLQQRAQKASRTLSDTIRAALGFTVPPNLYRHGTGAFSPNVKRKPTATARKR